jgi:hypothetical protein
VSLGTVAPGIKIRETMATTTIGTAALKVSSIHGGTVSCSVNGNLFHVLLVV